MWFMSELLQLLLRQKACARKQTVKKGINLVQITRLRQHLEQRQGCWVLIVDTHPT